VLSEGAGFVVLESEQHARSRGSRPLAVLEGFGSAQNAHHMVASPPDGKGPAEAMAAALRDAKVHRADVPYVNAHGTGTRDNDSSESAAIRRAFGHHADALMISSVKGVLGHTMGAAGAIEVALATRMLNAKVIPPTINLHVPDPRCDLDYVPNQAREVPRLDRVLTNSFGFGGQAATLLLRAS
jgi:3-oxoacyl-[acyl-carrier-protein] synthase II